MLKFLNKPYPSVIEDGYLKPNVINLIICLVIIGILYVFKPSNAIIIANIDFNLLNSTLFGLITFIISSIFSNILPRLFPKTFHYASWTVKKEIIFVFVLVFTISIINFLFGWFYFFNSLPFEFSSFFRAIYTTFIIGFIPIFLAISINLLSSQKKSQEGSVALNKKLIKPDNKANQKSITIKGLGKYETLDVRISNLLFIESTGNYCDIYYLLNHQISKQTFRSPLKEIERKLIPHKQIYRSHRSFLINLNKVLVSSGNAQGYLLKLEGFDDKLLPVSRSKIESFNLLFDK
jgi:small-conductance mechanosensitive channel